MSNRILRATLCSFLCLTISPVASAAPAKRNITEKDLFDFVWIGDPQMSPDGSRVTYVRVSVNEKKTGYNTAIWIVPTTGDAAPSPPAAPPGPTSPPAPSAPPAPLTE